MNLKKIHMKSMNLTARPFSVCRKERALLLDTGCGIGDLKGVIRKITDKPYIVIASHGHMDHIGRAGAFDELYINPADNYFLDVSLKKCWKTGEIMQILSGRGRINIILTAQREDMLCWRENRSCFRYPTVRHSILEGVSLRLYSCPGHTPGEMILSTRKPGICSVPMRVTVIFC